MTAPKRRATAPLPLVLAALAVVAASRPADAGAVYNNGVVISDSGGWGSAFGALGPARHSDNGVELIGCSVWRTPGYTSGFCQAANYVGTYRACWTDEPELVEVMLSVGPLSEITFEWFDWGRCAAITVANGSTWL